MKEFIQLDKSDRPLKKYVFVYKDDDKIKKIHFGSKYSSTYLDHHDKIKRANYLKRHRALGEDWSKINAGSLSALLLWGDTTDLNKNLKNYLYDFKISSL
jgi:hypothetical protein